MSMLVWGVSIIPWVKSQGGVVGSSIIPVWWSTNRSPHNYKSKLKLTHWHPIWSKWHASRLFKNQQFVVTASGWLFFGGVTLCYTGRHIFQQQNTEFMQTQPQVSSSSYLEPIPGTTRLVLVHSVTVGSSQSAWRIVAAYTSRALIKFCGSSSAAGEKSRSPPCPAQPLILDEWCTLPTAWLPPSNLANTHNKW